MNARWPAAIRVLHWWTLLLVVVTIPTIYFAQALTESDTDSAERLAGLHIVIGLAILASTLLRLAMRLALPAPAAVDRAPALRLAAGLVAGLLYGLLLAIPLTGILKLTLSGLDVSAFGVTLIPSFFRAQAVARVLAAAHEWLAEALMALALAHAAMALAHRRMVGGDVLGRMV